MWNDLCGVFFFLFWFGLGGRPCSNFVESTVGFQWSFSKERATGKNTFLDPSAESTFSAELACARFPTIKANASKDTKGPQKGGAGVQWSWNPCVFVGKSAQAIETSCPSIYIYVYIANYVSLSHYKDTSGGIPVCKSPGKYVGFEATDSRLCGCYLA